MDTIKTKTGFKFNEDTKHAIKFLFLLKSHLLSNLRTSLNLLEEIQLTGDIFFPKHWLDATFSGHLSKEALTIVDKFLDENKNSNERLMQKVLQSTDLL